ncbi:MAG: DUF2807 domain-containing protein [Myxococcales bacterium]|nr:DUF2807 domain-containing protein [Myxococcales bacterium]MCB9735436.1 DUF2807 domain-containing protein [Deltaproteobacteria bacterium]
MSPRRPLFALALALAAPLALAPAACDLRIDTDDGSVDLHVGPWEPFDAVRVTGDAAVEVHVDPFLARPTVSVSGAAREGDAGIVTALHGGTLEITGGTPAGVVVVVEVPRLAAVTVVGGGDVGVYEVFDDRLDLELVGSGTIAAEGAVRALGVTARGDGVVDASRLRARTIDVDARGGALATVCASGDVDAIARDGAVIVRACE